MTVLFYILPASPCGTVPAAAQAIQARQVWLGQSADGPGQAAQRMRRVRRCYEPVRVVGASQAIAALVRQEKSKYFLMIIAGHHFPIRILPGLVTHLRLLPPW